MPRARKGSAPRKGGQRRRGGAQSRAQGDSGSSEDEAASEARSTASDCPSVLSTTAEDSFGGDAMDEQSQQAKSSGFRSQNAGALVLINV